MTVDVIMYIYINMYILFLFQVIFLGKVSSRLFKIQPIPNSLTNNEDPLMIFNACENDVNTMTMYEAQFIFSTPITT